MTAALKDVNVSSSLMLCGSVFQRAGAQIEKLRSPYLLLERGTSSLLQSMPERKARPPTYFESRSLR